MSRAQPQQARGFEFYNPQQPQQQQQQQQQQFQQRPGNVQPALSFQTTAPTLSSSPCNQYVASPRLPAGIGQQGPPGTGLYSEPAQFVDARRPALNAEADSMRRELDKSRAQIAQLEKTLKWWSDCTANWREKWSKEKAERKKLKEELTQMRSSFDQSLARELERMKMNEDGGIETGTSPSRRAMSVLTTTGVGTGDTLQRGFGVTDGANRGEQTGLSVQTESTANFELQELLAETTSALEHERSENAELKSEIDRMAADQTALKSELNVLKETIGTLGGGSKDSDGKNGSTDGGATSANGRAMALCGLPSSVVQLMDSLQARVEVLEKEVSSRQMERLSDWNLIDRLESERALLRAENDRLVAKVEDIERILINKSTSNGDEDGGSIDAVKVKELESLRAEAHCLRRLVNRQTQELDHVNFLLSNQETETKLLRSRLLQPWGSTAGRVGANSATSSSSGVGSQSQSS